MRPAGPPAARRAIRARYDAAAWSPDSYRHWSNADTLSAAAALSPGVRRTLRARARYESSNNSYCRGIVLTLANALIATGPRLQLQTDDDAANDRVEKLFQQWAEATNLADYLRTMRQSKAVDGEAFALAGNNPRLDHEIALDLRLVEADQIADPYDALAPERRDHVDGITYDAWGNPITYSLLTDHPGSPYYWASQLTARPVPARYMVHWYRVDRPGQCRGVPEITAALPLFAQLRRFNLATLAAAETAADYSAVLYTDQPPAYDEAAAAAPDPAAFAGPSPDHDPAFERATPSPAALAPDASAYDFDTYPIEQRTMIRLPAGWKLEQFDAKQPTATHDAFTKRILAEIARSLLMPYAVAAGDASGMNYASSRQDYQGWWQALTVERAHLAAWVLRRVFELWLDEAALLPGYLPRGLPARNVPHAWIWPAFPHVDPQKEAAAQAIRLANMTTTYAAEFAADGLDYKTAFTQLAREKKLMQELGLSTAPQPPGSAPATDQPPPDDEEIPDDQAEADEAEADDDDDEDENDVD